MCDVMVICQNDKKLFEILSDKHISKIGLGWIYGCDVDQVCKRHVFHVCFLDYRLQTTK